MIEYDDSHYVNIPGSPFNVFNTEANVDLYSTYEDLL